MEDLAASLMSHSHSAPLYLLYDVSGFPKHGLAPPLHDGDGDDDGFEFATAVKNGDRDAALRACASDVSAAFADELFRAGVLLPLRLPPRLQRPARSAGASAAASPTSSAALHAGRRKHRGFDPFAAALEKVRREGAGAAAAAPRRARSLSPLRGALAAGPAHKTCGSRVPRATATAAAAQKAGTAVVARRARRGVRHLLCRAVMAGAAEAPRALRSRRKDGVSYRPGLLVCFGF